jgi:thiopeptide-type bacteriocin biosynthesis protein
VTSSPYLFSGFAYARASTLDRLWPRPTFDFSDHDAILTTAGRAWLRQLWDRDDVRAALTTASPDLVDHIEEALKSPTHPANRLRRLLRSVYTYLLRWERRATPFGRFAGVLPVRIGAAAKVRFGSAHREVEQVGADELHARAETLELGDARLSELVVCTNNLAVHRADRVLVAAAATEDQLKRGTLVETAVRATAPVREALALAAKPIRFEALGAALRAAFPHVPAGRVEELLFGLVKSGHLIPDSIPSMTDFAERAATVAAVRRPSDIHLAVDGEFTLPQHVVDAAETAAAALIRLSPNPYGTVPWREYLQRFLETYGPGALVPVRELTSDAGLGYPAEYLGAAVAKSSRSLSDRDAAVLEVIQAALIDGSEEVELTAKVLDRIQVGNGEDLVLPPRVELMFRIEADDLESMNRGRFRLWLTGVPRPQSSLAGRFTPLFEAGEPADLASSYTLPAGRIPAQLSFPPRRTRNATLAAVPALLPHLIPLGEHPPHAGASIIELDDLAVTADATQMYLVRRSTGELVEASMLHALDVTVHTPPLARFLSEVAGAGRTRWGPVDLGIARTLPYLPRIRVGRAVLAPARWLINADVLPGRNASMGEWDQAFELWRAQWCMGRTVEFVSGDSRLPLDLRDRRDRFLLRSQLVRKGELEVAEHERHQNWAGRASEFVMAFRSRRTLRRPSLPPTPVSELEIAGGGTMIAATLHVHPRRQNDLVAEQLPALADRAEALARSVWFTRFHDNSHPDSDHVIHLRMRARDEMATQELHKVLRSWAGRLRTLDLLAGMELTGYRHQAGRWGTDLRTAEAVFSADTQAAIAELSHHDGSSIDAVVAVSLVDLAAALAPRSSTGWQWLCDVLPHESVRVDARIRDQAFASRRDTNSLLAAAWKRRREALREFRQALAPERTTLSVLRSLLHEHVARTVGIDPDRERLLSRLARTVALRNLHSEDPK